MQFLSYFFFVGAFALLGTLIWSVAMWFLPAEKWEKDAIVATFGRKSTPL